MSAARAFRIAQAAAIASTVAYLLAPRLAAAASAAPTVDALDNLPRVSLVFGAETPRSPVSAFGHTFLVFHRDPFPEPDAVALEFTADLRGSGGNAVAALFATVPGAYRLTWFGDKVFEYEGEDRDLWVYELRMTPSERERLQAEVAARLAAGPFPYNFVAANCSSRVHEVLETALGGFECPQKPYSFPVASVRAALDCDRVARAFHRPSHLARVVARYESLAPDERAIWRHLRDEVDLPPPSGSPALRPALGEMLSYRIPRAPIPEDREALFHSKRSFPVTDASPIVSVQPDAAAPRAASTLSASASVERRWLTLSFAPLQRSLLSASSDPLRTSSIRLLATSVTFRPRAQPRLSELVLADLESMIPATVISQGFVRKVELAYRDWRPRPPPRWSRRTPSWARAWRRRPRVRSISPGSPPWAPSATASSIAPASTRTRA